MAQNSFSNFVRELHTEPSCEIISKSVHRFSRSCLKFFLYLSLAAILFNRTERFEQFWWTITKGTFLYYYFKINALVKEETSIKGFSIFSSGGHLNHWSVMVWAILVIQSPKELFVKLFQNLPYLQKIALAAILFNGAERFEQFW